MAHFSYQRRVAFCDTDAMGVVHHSNYIRYLEEARVAWMRAHQLNQAHFPHSEVVLAVVKVEVHHEAPAFFDDALAISLQVRREGLKIHFRYAIYREPSGNRVAWGETIHVPVNKDLKAVRPDKLLSDHLEKEQWIETWPLNS